MACNQLQLVHCHTWCSYPPRVVVTSGDAFVRPRGALQRAQQLTRSKTWTHGACPMPRAIASRRAVHVPLSLVGHDAQGGSCEATHATPMSRHTN